jgi:hypothetical protein
LQYSPGSLPTDASARRAAHDFANLVGRVVNTTLSDCPISFHQVVEARDFEGYVAHTERKAPVPMRLRNGRYLYLYQRLGLRRDERYLTTLEYKYQYQAIDDDESWIFRYEYQREPEAGYPYPLSHLHVNGSPEPYSGGKPFPRLHLPTGARVTIEDVVTHLLGEHELPAISPGWQEVVAGARAAFAEIQRRRLVDG